MIKRYGRFIIWLILLLVGVLILIWWVIAKRPVTSSPQKPTSATISGKITDTAGHPLSGIVISIDGSGTKTEAGGSYILPIYREGRQLIYFDSSSGEDQYQPRSHSDQLITVTFGQSYTRNFVIEKVSP
jgi:hypothetical protein